MFCPKCGKQIPNDSKFCAGCGASLEKYLKAYEEPEKPVEREAARPEIANTEEPKQSFFKSLDFKKPYVFMPCIAVIVVIAVVILILSNSGARTRQLQDVYNSFHFESLSDSTILTDEEKDTLATFESRRAQVLENKNLNEMVSLKEEWDSFSAPIIAFIDRYESAHNNFFSSEEEELLTEDERSKALSLQETITECYQKRDEAGMNAAAQEYESYTSGLKEIFGIYREMKRKSFSETERSLLPSEDLEEMSGLSDRIETVFSARDLPQIRELQNDWDSFINRAAADLEAAKKQLLQKWVDDANTSASLMNLFTFGTLTQTTRVEGHQIVFATQYNVEMNASDKEIKNGLDTYLQYTSSVFQSGVDYLKQYVNDVSIRVEYKNSDGQVVSYKEFR